MAVLEFGLSVRKWGDVQNGVLGGSCLDGSICVSVLDFVDAGYDVFHVGVLIDPGGWVPGRQLVDSAQGPAFHLKEWS